MSEAGNECLESKVPPGFRFHPTDEELLTYYLRKKLASERFDLDVIKEVDLNKLEPWDLHEKCKIEAGIHQTDWYFFSHKDRKYPTGTRTNRATAAGFWKATGRDKSIFSTSQCIGMRKTLVFYKGRAPHGEKTDWIMHEYRLDEVENTDDSWVVCRVFKKKCMHLKTERDTNSEYSNQLHATSDKEDEIDLPPQFMTSTGNQYYYYYNSTNQAETQGPGIIAMNNTATEILPRPSVMNQLYPAIGLASICKQELEERRSPYLSPLLQLPPLISPNKLSYDPCASSSSSSSSSSSTLTLYNQPHLSQDPIHYLQMRGDPTRQTLPPLYLKTNADEEQHLLRPLLVPNHDLLYNITSTSTAAKAKSSVGEWINPSLLNDPNSSSNNNNNNMGAPFSRQPPFDYAPPRSTYDVELWSSFCR